MNVLILSRFILFFISVIISCQFTSAQKETDDKAKRPYYIKDLSGTFHYYENINEGLSRYYCSNNGVVEKVFPSKQVASGFIGFNGRQFFFGKITKGRLVEGKKYYKILVHENGNLIFSYAEFNGKSYYAYIDNKVTRISLSTNDVSNWEDAFTNCSEYETIFNNFNTRTKEDNLTVYDLISLLSSTYYRNCFEEY